MTWLVERGHPIEFVRGLDIHSFDSLHESCTRLDAQQKIERAWSSMLAAQGEGKDMKKWVDQWKPYLDDVEENGAARFLAKYGKGI